MDSGLTSYHKALDALYARTGATSRYGLERTLAFLETIGNPHERIRTIHVAGTNGKGSVVALLYALLRSRGISVGRYTSPHLVDFRERIVVDDTAVSEEYVLAFLDRWEPAATAIGATFFEITTAMAFHYFASLGVDVAVIETGLGGRLDSTNVIHPVVAGITSISIDHTELLGNTEREIAAEKAGIFKRDVPAVIGRMSTEARVSVYRTARLSGVASVMEAHRVYRPADVDVSLSGTSFTMSHGDESAEMHTALVGSVQADNVSVAMTMLRAAGSSWAVSLDKASEILPTVTLPGRFQRIGNRILDVAHNPDGIRLLVETIQSLDVPRPVTAILGVLGDKDWRAMIALLAPCVDELILVTAPSAPQQRSWDPAAALAAARGHGMSARIEPEFAAAVEAQSEGTVLITGSFHTVGDALALIG